jgi:hypothetical protein
MLVPTRLGFTTIRVAASTKLKPRIARLALSFLSLLSAADIHFVIQ